MNQNTHWPDIVYLVQLYTHYRNIKTKQMNATNYIGSRRLTVYSAIFYSYSEWINKGKYRKNWQTFIVTEKTSFNMNICWAEDTISDKSREVPQSRVNSSLTLNTYRRFYLEVTLSQRISLSKWWQSANGQSSFAALPTGMLDNALPSSFSYERCTADTL